MRRSVPAAALWFEPRSDVWTVEFLRRLASLASATPFGTSWMVGRRSGTAGAVVVAGDPVAADVVGAAAAPVPGRLVPVGAGALGVPSERDRFGVVRRSHDEPRPVPGTTASGLDLPRGPSASGPRRAAPPPPGGRQCHWFSTGAGRLAVRVRFWVRSSPSEPPSSLASAAADIVDRLGAEGIALEVREVPNSRRRRAAWSEARIGPFAQGPLERWRPGVAGDVAAGPAHPARIDEAALGRHVVVVGASGAGKTSLLARLAAERIEGGGPVVGVDLHGDLGPSIAAQLSDAGRGRLVAIDGAGPVAEIPGVPLLDRPGGERGDREAAHLVAALKRLTSDSGDVYWGYRLERTLEAFVRLAQEEGGGLADVHALLTDVRRRDAARLSTRSPALASYLDELPALLRRNPEYLGAATARVAKVALEPRLAALLDASGSPVSVEKLLAEGRSVLWRLPFAELGPESAAFAATLLLTHVYLRLAALGPSPDGGIRALFLVDEASAVSPKLLVEILGEGRKFGVGALVATQYPGRLAPEARAAAEGAAGTHVVFRVPAPAAVATAAWAGLDRSEAEILGALPDGTGLVVRSGDDGGRAVLDVPPSPHDGGAGWTWAVRATSREHVDASGERPGGSDRIADAVVFALAAGPADVPTIVERAGAVSGEEFDAAALSAVVQRLRDRGWVAGPPDAIALTDAGNRYLGLGAPTEAASESAQHRALLYEAFRLLGRRGARAELVRQGRFDRRLPDAMVRQLGGPGGGSPRELARRVDRARATWTWRYFGGRDVHVEAEVSGAVRPDRIRRNLEKARTRGCHVLFLVADPVRARRLRAILDGEAAGRDEATVWTLAGARLGVQAGGAATTGRSFAAGAGAAEGSAGVGGAGSAVRSLRC